MLAKLFILTLLACPVPGPSEPPAEGEVSGKLGRALDDYMTRCEVFGFSGAVLVEQKGKTLLRKGYGLAQADGGVPNTSQTLFDIASASKQVTAAAILLLEAEGRLSLDDPISEHLPDVPREHKEVTLHHLLTHTSGWPRNGPSGSGSNRDRALATYFGGERSGKAGKRFEYYNGGYAMLAAVVEEVTGAEFEGWVREHLFEPAGMQGTDFIETRRVDEGLLSRAEGGRGRLTTEYIQGWGYKGMGGVLTSVNDLQRWMRALLGGDLLPKAQLEQMLTPFKENYALGWYVFETDGGRQVVQHGGTAPGFQSYIRHFVEDEVTIAVLANCDGMHWQVTWGLGGIVLDEDPKAEQPPELADWKAKQLDEVCRTWEGDLGKLVIERSGAGLSVGVLGGELIEALSGRGAAGSGSGGGKEPSARELAEASELALELVADLREGDVSTLEERLMPRIPKSWPGRIRDQYWPEHEARWGPVRGQAVLGAFYDSGRGLTRVWVELDHETGPRSIEIAFRGDELNIFDLKAARYPLTLAAAPVEDDLIAGFDFSGAAPFELKLTGRKGKRSLELRTKSGEQDRLR